MDQDFTYIDDIAASQRYRFLSLTVVVSENDGVITITAEGLCKNGIYYVMTCNTVITPTALENTCAEVKATKLVENGQIVILRGGKKFNLMGAEF